MSTFVVLPSWSKLNPDLEVETGSRFSAFINLGGRPLYKHIVNFHSSLLSPRFFVVVPPEAPKIEIEKNSNSRIHRLELENSASIGETVLAALVDLKTSDSIVVNMADTLVSLAEELCLDAIYTQPRSDLYRWTSVVENQDGSIHFPQDRDDSTVGDPQAVCVGLFTFSEGHSFRTYLKAAVESESGAVDPFFVAIENYSKKYRLNLCTPSTWFDCGHVDTYYEARLGYQNLRHFNKLEYESFKGQVTKTSIKIEQFRHQVRWFKQVPDALSAFLPRIFDSSDGDQPFIKMELLSIPTLSEIFVSKRISPGAWNGVVRTIDYISKELRKYSFTTSLAKEVARSVYLDKTRARLQDFMQQNSNARQYHVMNDGHKIDLSWVLSELDCFVEKNGLLDINSLSPIHGDFCFSNLLFDPKVRVVKLIDPRGEFGLPGIYGDPRYDLAKLSHSFAGGYDFIVSDQFNVDLNAVNEIKFDNKFDSYHKQVKDIFESTLLTDSNLRKQVMAIEALLFLSMLPLHADAPKRQLAMLATGLRLFASCEIAEIK